MFVISKVVLKRVYRCMDIFVVGAGSVGMLVASFLAEQSHHVTMITRRNEQKEKLLENGLVRKGLDGSVKKCNVSVSTHLENVPNNSMIFVTVKYGQLKNIYPTLTSIPKNIPIVFLQNGLAHFEEAIDLPNEQIVFGSCQFGAQKENDFTVNHRGVGVLKVASGKGKSQILQLLHKFSTNDFPIEIVDDAEQMLFEKALLNCFINPLTAILNVKNGHLVESTYTKNILHTLYDELIDAFPEQQEQFPFSYITNLCKKTAENTSSMLSDRLNNRPTEVDTIVGAVIKKAERRNKKVPTLETLYQLLLAIEEIGDH